MTAAEQEALKLTMAKKAADMEKGLSRRDAILTAFKLCFPVDYEECIKQVKDSPGGTDNLYEFLEEAIKTALQAHEKGPPLNAEPEKADISNPALQTPLNAQNTQSGAKQSGLEGLKGYVTRKPA